MQYRLNVRKFLYHGLIPLRHRLSSSLPEALERSHFPFHRPSNCTRIVYRASQDLDTTSTTFPGSCHLCTASSVSPLISTSTQLTAHSTSSDRRSMRYHKSTGTYPFFISMVSGREDGADVRNSVLQRHETEIDGLCERPDFPVGDQGG
jgi:hypothetical protein